MKISVEREAVPPGKIELNKECQDFLRRSQQEFEVGHRDRAEEFLEKALVADPMLILREHMPVGISVSVGPNTISVSGNRS